MLTRRAFTGVVSCAVCAMASEFMATEAAAQATPPAATAGVTRKILSQTDGPAPGYQTLLVEATIEAGGGGGGGAEEALSAGVGRDASRRHPAWQQFGNGRLGRTGDTTAPRSMGRAGPHPGRDREWQIHSGSRDASDERSGRRALRQPQHR